MNDRFKRCVGAAFRHFGALETYTPTVGDAFSVKVVRGEAEDSFELHGSRLHGGGDVFEIQASAFLNPSVRDDRFTFEGDTYLVKGDPDLDKDKLIYILDCRKI